MSICGLFVCLFGWLVGRVGGWLVGRSVGLFVYLFICLYVNFGLFFK